MELVKESIKALKGYHVPNLPFKIKLDANEGRNVIFEDGFDFNKDFKINFYPDSDATQLRKEIGAYLGIKESKIVVGNGSSEMIDLIMKAFVDKDQAILTFVPTFSMYAVYSQIYSAQLIGVESEEDFSLDIGKLIEKEQSVKSKVILLCNPNNPTGYQISTKDIKRLLEKTKALVVVDEAYMEFSEGSMINELESYPNLVIIRTLSKAFGLAGIRLGYLIANESMIEVINRVKAPYNLNVVTQYIGIQALQKKDRIKEYIEEVKQERQRVYRSLKAMNFEVYRSFGNFVFFRCEIKDLAGKMAKQGILIRNFTGNLRSYYRVSIGRAVENDEFIRCLKEIK